MGKIELFLFLPSSCRLFCQPGFHRQASFLSQRAVKESPVPKQVTQAVLIQFYYYTRNYPKVSSAINMLFLPPPSFQNHILIVGTLFIILGSGTINHSVQLSSKQQVRSRSTVSYRLLKSLGIHSVSKQAGLNVF